MQHSEHQVDSIVKNKFPEYIQLLEQCFDFKRWGFRQDFSGDVKNSSPSIVYSSEWCRVRFIWEIPDARDSSDITYILYGRTHAPVEKRIMEWKGEKCYCWHEIDRALEFLDGMTPQVASNRRFKLPPFMQEFYEESLARGWHQPEFRARTHAAVWDHYGQRLFDLFDIRHPELWQEYTDFLTKYYELWPNFVSNPPIHKIA